MADLNMGVKKHRDFVDRLANDDELRQQFQADPEKVLHDHGIGFDPAAKPGSSGPITSEQIKLGRDNLVKSMDDGGGWDLIEMGSWDLKEH